MTASTITTIADLSNIVESEFKDDKDTTVLYHGVRQKVISKICIFLKLGNNLAGKNKK